MMDLFACEPLTDDPGVSVDQHVPASRRVARADLLHPSSPSCGECATIRIPPLGHFSAAQNL